MLEAHKDLPDHWKCHFPRNMRESQKFEPVIFHKALNVNVLAVARTRIEGAWGAYIAAVPGLRHEDERAAVLGYGAKLREPVARAIFPMFKGVPYAR